MHESKIRRYLKHGTLPQLRVFEAVTRHGSFTRAAEELYMAQPTVSIHMKKLAETVGLPLIEQVGRSLHLTAAGRELHLACQGIFQTLADVEDTLTDLRDLKAGSLRVATSTAGKQLVPRLLAEFVKAHGGIKATLHVNCRRVLMRRLNANADDLYVFVNPPEDEQVEIQRILPNPLVVFARADHPLARRRNIAFACLAREPLLMREPGSGTRMVTDRMFAAHALEPRVGMELGSDEAIKETLLAGFGVAILYRHSLGLDFTSDQLAMLDVEGFPQEAFWYSAYPRGKRLSIVVQAFMEFMRREAGRVVSHGLAQPGLAAVSGPPSAMDAAQVS